MELRGASSAERSPGMWESSGQEPAGSRTSRPIPSWLVASAGLCCPAQEKEPFPLSGGDQMSLVRARAGSGFHLSRQIYSCPNGFLANPRRWPDGCPSLTGGGRRAQGRQGSPRAASLVSAAPNARTSRRSPAGVQPQPELGERDRKALLRPGHGPAGEGGEQSSPLLPSPTQPHTSLPSPAQPHTAPQIPHATRATPHCTKCFHLPLQAGNTFMRKMMQENRPCTRMDKPTHVHACGGNSGGAPPGRHWGRREDNTMSKWSPSSHRGRGGGCSKPGTSSGAAGCPPLSWALGTGSRRSCSGAGLRRGDTALSNSHGHAV